MSGELIVLDTPAVEVLDNIEILDARHMLRVIRIVNPFDPRERVIDELEWFPTKTLGDYFPAGTGNTVVSINGKIIPFDDFPLTFLSPDDNLVVCPVPHGGKGGSKSIIGAIAMIAVAIFAPYAAGGIAGMMAGGDAIAGAALVGSAGLAAITAGVTIAGTLLVHSLIAPSQATDQGSGKMTNSSSYGIDGSKNTSQEGLVLPVLYGEFRMAGNVIDMFMVNSGDTQILYMRMAICEGGIAYVGDFEVNDQPASQVPGVAFDVRGGWHDQPVMGWFSDTVRPYTKQTKITTDWTVHESENIDMYRLDFVAPTGLYWAWNPNGQLAIWEVDFEIHHRNLDTGGGWEAIRLQNEFLGYRTLVCELDGNGIPGGALGYVDDQGQAWVYVPTQIVWTGWWWSLVQEHYEKAAAAVYVWKWADANQWPGGATYADRQAGQIETDPTLLAYCNANAVQSQEVTYVGAESNTTINVRKCSIPIYATAPRMADAKRAAVRKSFQSQQLPRGRYEIRWRRINVDTTIDIIADDVYITDVNEILLEDLMYPHTALLGVQVVLNEQVSGLPKITFRALGRCIYVNRLRNIPQEPAGRNWYFEYNNNPAWIVWDILTNTRFGGGLAWDRLDLAAFQSFADNCQANGLYWNGPIDQEMNVWDACQLVLRVGRAQLVGVGTRYTVVMETQAVPTMMFSVANIIDGTFKETWLGLTDRANEIEVTYFDRADSFKQHTIKVYDPAALIAGRPQKSAAITLYGVTDHDQAYREGVLQLNLNRYVLQTIEFGAPMEAVACTVGDLIYVQHDMPQWGFGGRCEAGSTQSVINLDRPVAITGGKAYKLLIQYDTIPRWGGTITQIIGNSVWINAGFPYNGTDVQRFVVGSLDKQIMGMFDMGNGTFGQILSDVTGLAVGQQFVIWSVDWLEERDVVPIVGSNTQLQVTSPFNQIPAIYAKWMFGEVGKFKKPFRVKAISGSHDYRRDITAVEYNESVYNNSVAAVPVPNYSSLSSVVDQAVIESVEEILFQNGSSFRSHVTVHFHSDQETYARSSVYHLIAGTNNWQLTDQNAFDRATVDLDEGQVVTFKVVARDVVGTSANSNAAPTVTYTVLGKLAPPTDVTNFTSQIGSNAIVLKWNANQDIDLSGYEVREGKAWDTATVLVQDLASTAFLVPKNDGGTFTFLIRAIDTSGKYSVNPVATTITLSPPASVTGFDCVQNGTRIEFRWDANSENRLTGYEIREGQSWSVGKLVSQVSATTYSMPASSIPGARTFWIKAIVEPGVRSVNAVFSTTQIAQPTDRNLIVTDDELAKGWTGSKFQLSVQNNALQLDAGKTYGEYTWAMVLPKTYRARNSIVSSFGAVILDSTSWAAASWAWADQQASRAWIVAGDLTTVDLGYYISKYVGLAATYTEGFGLSNSTTGERGTVAANATGVTYAPGRFLNGVVLNDTTTLDWNVAVPALFNMSFWAIPTAVTGDQVYWSGLTADGKKLVLGYNASASAFYLEDTNGGPVITLPYTISVNDRVLVALVQTAAVRKLYVGALNGAAASAQANVAPLGALTAVRLHE